MVTLPLLGDFVCRIHAARFWFGFIFNFWAGVNALMGLGLKEGDARVIQSGICVGANTLTRDKDVLRKAPGITESF
jgi:hypothetical protein